MFVLQIYRKERTGEKTGAEGQRRKRVETGWREERKWKLLEAFRSKTICSPSKPKSIS